MVISTLHTFTVPIDVREWMDSASQSSKLLLMSYLEDLTETMPLEGQATACSMESSPFLWFTFDSAFDCDMFAGNVAKVWREGWWLSND